MVWLSALAVLPALIAPLLITAATTATAAGISGLASRLFSRGQAQAGKEAARQADIASQAQQVENIAGSFGNLIASLDPSAPELSSYLSFASQKIQTVASPEDEQSQVRAEGERVLALVRERTNRERVAALAQAQTVAEIERVSEAERLKGAAEERAFRRSLELRSFELREAQATASLELERERVVAQRPQPALISSMIEPSIMAPVSVQEPKPQSLAPVALAAGALLLLTRS